MLNRKQIIKEIARVENKILGVQSELKTLKNRVRAYKGWTRRYRKQLKSLEQEAIILRNNNRYICQEKDRLTNELDIKQQELLQAIINAKEAKEDRDLAISQLDAVIFKIEEYRAICEKANKITYADKVYLIKAAEKLFFDDEIINLENDIGNWDSKDKPQMFTDRASINRSLLDS